MLFVLVNELLPFCSADNGQELEGLQNLLLSVRQGKHAVVGPYNVFNALARNTNLSERERATALSLANRRMELGLLERQIQNKVFVLPNIDAATSKRLPEASWRICVCELNSKFLSALVLLAENMVDAELYQQAAKHYQIKNKFNGLVVRSTARGGGGSQIDVELASLLNDGIPVFAITDGDFTFPKKPLSTISSRCEALIAQERGLGWHIALPVREVENIVPLNVLLEVADPQIAGDAHRSTLEISGALDGSDRGPRNFVCFKAGLTLSQTFKCDSEAERDYWVGIANSIKDKRPKSFGQCLDQMSCSADPCSCRITVGFGEAVLAQVRKWLVERSPHECLKSFDKSEIWMDIGAMVFDAAVAFQPGKI